MRYSKIRAIGGLAVLASLGVAGCTPEPGDDRLSGSPEDFVALSAPCSAAARRIATPVTIVSSLRTGGGPILVLTAGDMRYTCRQEADGSVAIFSELAN